MYQVFSFLSKFFTEPLHVNSDPLRYKYVNAVSPATEPLHVKRLPTRPKYVNAVSPATEPLHVNSDPLRFKYVNAVRPSTDPFVTDKLRFELICISVQYFKYEISIPFILGAFVASVKA